MKKKILATLTFMTVGLLALAGCSSGSGGKTDDSGGTSASKKTEMKVDGEFTELNVWTFIELHQKFYVDMAEKWNEENPDKKVKLTLSNMAYDDMHNKLSLSLESGKGAPDVADIELGKFPSFTSGKDVQLMDLTSAIDPYRDNIVESRLNIYSKDEKEYGLPTHVGATVAFYNTELLDEADIDYTTIKTWDDFKAAGIKYHEETGKNFAAAETTASWMINLMLAQKGGEFIDENDNVNLESSELQEVLEYVKDMQDAGAVATVPGGQPDNEEAYPSYNQGDFAVQIMPFWQTSRFTNYMTDLKGKIAIAPCPVFKEGDVQSVGGGGTGTVVIKSSEKAELASEVFAYIKLSETANEEVWNVLGFDPVNTAVWSETDLTQNPDNQFVQFFNTYPFDTLNEIKDSIASLDSFTSEKMPSVNNELCTTTLHNIFDSEMDIKEALKESQATLDNEFQ